MTNLYIDFDGVMVNTIEVTYKKMDDLNIDRKDQEAVGEFYREINWRDLLKETTQINNSMECIKNIVKSNLFNVYILSHVHSLPEAEAKVKYLRKYLDEITFIPVPRNIAKTTMVNATNQILIDDYSGNLRIWEEHGGIGVKFSQKPEGKEFPVLNKLDMIIEMHETGIL